MFIKEKKSFKKKVVPEAQKEYLPKNNKGL